MISQKSHAQPGFNFIEMMVVLVIIGILAGMVGPRVMGLLGRGKRTSTENTLKMVKQGLKQYKMDIGVYPEKLEDLVRKPEGVVGWQSPYVGSEDEANPSVPKDAWNQDLVYKLNPRGATPPFELYSIGDPDKEEDRIDAK